MQTNTEIDERNKRSIWRRNDVEDNENSFKKKGLLPTPETITNGIFVDLPRGQNLYEQDGTSPWRKVGLRAGNSKKMGLLPTPLLPTSTKIASEFKLKSNIDKSICPGKSIRMFPRPMQPSISTINSPSADKDTYLQLSTQIHAFEQRYTQTDELIGQKQNLCSYLLLLIRKRFPNSSLYLFGSSMNGFGLKFSDVDLCLITSPIATQQETLVHLRILEIILSRIPQFQSVELIQARVSIIKFKDSISGSHCDLSVNNAMAIRNTYLLKTYSMIDARVKPLVLAVKKWANFCDINDPSQGTLSSYALVLMCIHFFQCGCDPPVLISLQKHYPQHFRADSEVGQLKIKHKELLEEVCLRSSKNTSSVGQLFVQFFEYFSTRFSWETKVISICEGCTLPKKNYEDKGFSDKYICVADPFEAYNTARTVYSLSAADQIKREFHRTHKLLLKRGSLEHIMS